MLLFSHQLTENASIKYRNLQHFAISLPALSPPQEQYFKIRKVAVNCLCRYCTVTDALAPHINTRPGVHGVGVGHDGG